MCGIDECNPNIIGYSGTSPGGYVKRICVCGAVSATALGQVLIYASIVVLRRK